MNETIVFPDATSVTIDYLLDRLAEHAETIPVVKDIPDPRPARFVRVLRLGGPRRNLVVDQATLAVESWDDDPAGAMDLAQLVRGLLHAAEGVTEDGTTIYTVDEFSGPAELPDPLSNQPRVTQQFSIGFRGSALTGS